LQSTSKPSYQYSEDEDEYCEQPLQQQTQSLQSINRAEAVDELKQLELRAAARRPQVAHISQAKLEALDPDLEHDLEQMRDGDY
jgi:hypothetical protein